MSAITNWITALAAAVSATAICFLWAQTRLLKKQCLSTYEQLGLLKQQGGLMNEQLGLLQKQIVDDHERSRREMAINLILAWAEHLQRETATARRLVEALSEVQCRDLFGGKPLQLPIHLKEKIQTCLGPLQNGLTEAGDKVCLKENEVALIRWQTVRFLNTLEAIMSAWRHNIADRKILTEQFSYLFDPKEGFTILQRFRDAARGKAVYPAIFEFAQYVGNQLAKPEPGGGLLGKRAE